MAKTKDSMPEAKGSRLVEGMYSASELAGVARTRFRVPPEIVSIALKLAGKDKATFTEAQQIVKDFMERKVI